jgi:WD40 repeat protein
LNWSLFDPRILACCSDDKSVKVIDVRTGKPTMILTPGVGTSGVRWSPHYATVLASTHSSTVNVWDMRMNKVTATTIAHSSPITSIDWSLANADELATAASGHEQYVKFWSAEFLRSPKADLLVGSVGRIR